MSCLFEAVFIFFILSVKMVWFSVTRHPPSPKAMAGQVAVRHTAGTWRAMWEFWEFWGFWGMSIPILLHGTAAMRAAGLIYALMREMSVVHESGRNISSADFCLTAVQSAVLFLKLPTILNPLKLLILCGSLLSLRR